MEGTAPCQQQSLPGGLLHQYGSAGSQHSHGGQRQQAFQKYHAVHIHSHLVDYAGNDRAPRLNAH